MARIFSYTGTIKMMQYGFMQNAFIGGVLIAMLCSFIGPFLVLRRLSLLGDGLAHMAFGGIALGLLLGVNPLLCALAFTVLGSLIVQRLITKTKVYGDSATAVILSFGMAVAILIIGAVKGFNVNLFSYLFGSILAISKTDIIMIASIFLLTLVFVLTLYKKLVFVSFNEELARVSGININLINSLLAIVTAMAVVVSIRAVGILLVSALIVIPSISAFQVSKSFKQTLFVSSSISIISVVSGIVVAYYSDLPASGTIVLILCMFFIASLIYNKRNQKKIEHLT